MNFDASVSMDYVYAATTDNASVETCSASKRMKLKYSPCEGHTIALFQKDGTVLKLHYSITTKILMYISRKILTQFSILISMLCIVFLT